MPIFFLVIENIYILVSGVNDFKGFFTQFFCKITLLTSAYKALNFSFFVKADEKKGPEQRSSLVFMPAKGFKF